MKGSGSGISYLALTSTFSSIFESSLSAAGAGFGAAIDAIVKLFKNFSSGKDRLLQDGGIEKELRLRNDEDALQGTVA